jgi:drug/metabolite transporter (DMT)-like permease
MGFSAVVREEGDGLLLSKNRKRTTQQATAAAAAAAKRRRTGEEDKTTTMKDRYGTLLILLSFAALQAAAFSPSTSRVRPTSLALRLSERSVPTNAGRKRRATESLVDSPQRNLPWDAYQPQDRVPTVKQVAQQIALDNAAIAEEATSTTPGVVSEQEYQRGLLTIGFCTFVFASMSPAMHAALAGATAPPVLLLNAAVSVLALAGLIVCGPFLEKMIPKPSTLEEQEGQPRDPDSSSSAGLLSLLDTSTKAGMELGLWKALGTTANLYGLSLTTADHGAFLIQLTTLIVPVVQGIMGVPIPQRIQTSVALALTGVAIFTQDQAAGVVVPPSQTTGDLLCVVAAVFYATYDLRLFAWGKLVAARELITKKIATQAFLSLALLAAVGRSETMDFIQQADSISPLLIALVVWSGFMVNAIVPFLQVGGQQAIGPTRSQTLYASQPLWASIMSFCFLGETIGLNGAIGGTAFLGALFLAATTEAPDANCGEDQCEV